MKIVNIPLIKWVDASEHDPILLNCEHCKKETMHKTITQIVKSHRKILYVDDENLIEIPDLTDDYIIQCVECGNNIIVTPIPEEGFRDK